MPKFRYTATDAQGDTTSGVLQARNPAAVRNQLATQNLKVDNIKESKGFLSLEIGKQRVRRHDVMHLSRQLSAFVRAGVPILDGLEVIAEESSNTTLRQALYDIADDLRAGAPMSDAFSKHPSVFPRFYVDMLRSAELTGRLDTVLDQLASYMERDLEAKQKIRSALTYPIVVVFLALGTMVVMTAFVVPRFQVFFRSLGAKLPLSTRILIAITDFIANWWWALLAGTAGLVLSIVFGSRTKAGRSIIDRVLLRIPVIGEVIRSSIVERFCRMLAAMIEAGVPLPEAMGVVTEASNNTVYQRGLVQVQEQMLQGEGLYRPIANTKLFPTAVTQMIRVGEDTGTLDEQLESAASFYEQQLEFKIKRMTTLFEPGVLIVVGLLVGFVAIAVVSAMYGVFTQMSTIR